MRTVNGTAVSADYGNLPSNGAVLIRQSHIERISASAQGQQLLRLSGSANRSSTVRWQDVAQRDGRPIAYSAAGSHGLWPTPGLHVYAQLANLFKLVDETDTDGPLWDTKGHVVPIQYWGDPERRWRKRHHEGNMSWLNFVGLWGNQGERDCWWRPALRYCQESDGLELEHAC